MTQTQSKESDLKFTTSGTAKETMLDFYRQVTQAASVPRAIAFAIEQPAGGRINEIVLRPTSQTFRGAQWVRRGCESADVVGLPSALH